MNIRKLSLSVLAFFCIANIFAANVAIQHSTLVADRIVEFIPVGFDQSKTSSLILKKEPVSYWKCSNGLVADSGIYVYKQ